jgi:hypothetical protein
MLVLQAAMMDATIPPIGSDVTVGERRMAAEAIVSNAENNLAC